MKKLLLFILMIILLISLVSACIPTLKVDLNNENCSKGDTIFIPTYGDKEDIKQELEGNQAYFCESNDNEKIVNNYEFTDKDFEIISEFIFSGSDVIKQTEEEYKLFKKDIRKTNWNPFKCDSFKISRTGNWTGFKNNKKWYCKIFNLNLNKDLVQSTC